MSSPAYLLVFSKPGAGVSEQEFADWYDNEHIPLRLDIPAFLSWTRWKAADGRQPGLAASYDLTSYEDTLKTPYTTLAETRSEREKRIFKDAEIVERRTYELLEGPRPPPSSLYNPNKPARYIGFVSVNVKEGGDDVLSRWYDEEHLPMLAKLPGWVRSRRFILKDWARMGVEGQKDQQPPPKYLTVHELESTEAITDPKMIATWATTLKAEADKVTASKDTRLFDYSRHWEK